MMNVECRYFQPPNPKNEKEKPRVALDTSLTAYAQLSALKLNCQRSFISLIDHEKQYIIAEATRTVSLDSEDIHDGDDDAIYLGATTLDLEWGVCPNTIRLFTSTDESLNIAAPYIKANQSYYIMSDLSKIPGFETRPYVAGWPYMRYYAEVPIHSPSGLTIGSLCVVDDKPREGVNMRDIRTLTEVAHAVMDHLELVMSKVQRKRAERMIQGLGLFVEGSDSMRDWWMDSEQNSRNIDPGTRRLSLHEHADKVFGPGSPLTNFVEVNYSKPSTDQGSKQVADLDHSTADQFLTSSASQLPSDSTGAQLDSKSIASPAIDSITTDLQSSSISTRDIVQSSRNTTRDGSISKHSTALEPSKDDSARDANGQGLPKFRKDLKDMLSRATNLIREAVGLDGVCFLDPRSGRLRSHQDEQLQLGVRKISQDSSSHAESDNQCQNVPNDCNRTEVPIYTPKQPRDRQCKVLACSTRGDAAGCVVGTSTCSLAFPEKVLHRIIEMFPRGGVLKFDAEGLVSRSELELSCYDNIPKAELHSYFPNITRDQQESTYKSGLEGSSDIQELWHVLPNARSIILFPLWNPSRDKLFAYNIAWSCDLNRAFQREDFAYLASFGNSIMAELSRLDTIAADRAKADFISSISHELRSPLHGVLASAELLKALTKDTTSIDIINTIEACGSTLLDTMDNLLTFAKINNFTIAQQQKKLTVKIPALGESPPWPLKSLTSEIDLGFLVEEVMNANIAGHQFRTALEEHSSHSIHHSVISNQYEPEDSVTVMCDIESQLNWIFSTQGGAWKRILMNLLGNSLKYTSAGFIHVKLSQGKKMHINGSPQTSIYLSVEDSGKGISEDYLKHHLFTPFQQEDPLCPGTGLGLSIVQQLVTSIDGTIEVFSEVGSGTKVKITASLESLADQNLAGSNPIISKEALSQLNGRKLGLVGLDVYPNTGEAPTGILSRQARRSMLLKSSLVRCATEAFGLETVTVAALDSDLTDVDILMTTEAHFGNVGLITGQPRHRPLILLCSSLTLDYRPVSYENGPIIYLSQP